MISAFSLGFPINTRENENRESVLGRIIWRDATNVLAIGQAIHFYSFTEKGTHKYVSSSTFSVKIIK